MEAYWEKSNKRICEREILKIRYSDPLWSEDIKNKCIRSVSKRVKIRNYFLVFSQKKIKNKFHSIFFNFQHQKY